MTQRPPPAEGAEMYDAAWVMRAVRVGVWKFLRGRDLRRLEPDADHWLGPAWQRVAWGMRTGRVRGEGDVRVAVMCAYYGCLTELRLVLRAARRAKAQRLRQLPVADPAPPLVLARDECGWFLSRLSPRDRTLLEARFGVLTGSPLGLKDAGAAAGLSEQAACRIVKGYANQP